MGSYHPDERVTRAAPREAMEASKQQWAVGRAGLTEREGASTSLARDPCRRSDALRSSASVIAAALVLLRVHVGRIGEVLI
jgi:hypothetical protein